MYLTKSLKEYFDVKTAKEVGKISFDNTYNWLYSVSSVYIKLKTLLLFTQPSLKVPFLVKSIALGRDFMIFKKAHWWWYNSSEIWQWSKRKSAEGKAELLLKQLTKKFKKIPEEYRVKIKELTDETLEIIGLKIFDMEDIKELEKYF